MTLQAYLQDITTSTTSSSPPPRPTQQKVVTFALPPQVEIVADQAKPPANPLSVSPKASRKRAKPRKYTTLNRWDSNPSLGAHATSPPTKPDTVSARDTTANTHATDSASPKQKRNRPLRMPVRVLSNEHEGGPRTNKKGTGTFKEFLKAKQAANPTPTPAPSNTTMRTAPGGVPKAVAA